MIRSVFLDSGPLGLITNPKSTPETIAAVRWMIDLRHAGCDIIVPAIVDYEVRRELIRAGKTRGLTQLDAFIAAAPDRFLSLSDEALHLAAQLWAQARSSGLPTADPKELDGDVILAAQVLSLGIPASDFVIATTNPGHLSRFVPAQLWNSIKP